MRACERAGWPGEPPTWETVRAALRPTPFRWQGGNEAALLSAQRLWSGAPDGWRSMEEYARFDAAMRAAQPAYEAHLRRRRDAAALAPLVAEIAVLAEQLRGILRGIDPAAHDLTDADERALRERAEELASQPWALNSQLDEIEIRKRSDAAWWLRRLRREANRASLTIGQALGLVGAGQPFADANTLARWQQRQDAARRYGATEGFESDDGQLVTLNALTDAKAKAALSRLYGQLLGMQQIGDDEGLVPVFFTFTLDGPWHAKPKFKRPGHEWNGRPASVAREQLHADVRTFRRRLKAALPLFGLRVIEGHVDGTPHMHSCEWFRAGDLPRVFATLRRVFGSAHRAKAVRILPKRTNAATPATYCLKYLVKSLNDEGAAKAAAGQGGGSEDHLARHREHRAWAAAIGAHRWALTGRLSGIQRIWQTIYLWKEPPQGAPAAATQAWHAMRAAQDVAADPDAPDGATSAHWANAIRALVDLDDGAVLALTYEETETRYGDLGKRPVGLTDGAAEVPLSRRAWKRVNVKEAEKARENEGVALVYSCPRRSPDQDATAPAEDGEAPDNAPVEATQDDAEGDSTPGWAPSDALAAQISAVKRWRECHRQGIPCPHPASPEGRQDTSAETLGAAAQPGEGAVEAQAAPLDPQAALASWAYHWLRGLPCPWPSSLEGRQAIAEGRYPTPPQKM